MSNFNLVNKAIQNITCVPNAFIDTYMASANGSFIKVYLYLLRHSQEADVLCSITTLADALENTETDIIRALKYWHKERVLEVLFNKENEVTSVSFLSLEQNTNTVSNSDTIFSKTLTATSEYTAATSQTKPETENATTEVIPKKHTYSPIEAEALSKDSEVSTVLTLAETMMGEPLNSSHVQLILYLMTDLDFSSELVLHLYETSLAKGKKAPRYLETIALNWAKKGIRTLEEAEEETSMFNTKYNIVSKTLGFTRPLAPPERAIIDGWEKYYFSEAIITEACKRTILQTGDQNLNYTGKILADWFKNGVHTLADVEKLDKNFHKEREKTKASENKPVARSKNSFQNFSQRNYSEKEFISLEKQLLQK